MTKESPLPQSAELLQRFRAPELPDLEPGRPMADLVSALQQLKEARDELAAERHRNSLAQDETWKGLALFLHRLLQIAGDSESAVAIASLEENINSFFRANGLEIVDATWQDVNVLEPGEFEVMSVAKMTDPQRHDTVIETFEPAIRRNGRRIHCGKIIVAKHPEDRDSSAQTG